ncbi:peptidase [Actinoplanes ianthinogenes]|uniref:Peptidase n=1 Tax=Actinoplanes ianthinogenes TaxID=122358 RepID=A0ABM7M2U0_9ACTN|nr:oxygenase MpaB family protein [Actinoplanes ianthinogenes]BCJ45934.1 peptidase [Actinoplanes ianthinogenes]GGR31049.1 peptidase [Actinoplanes ianthinogenes]
MPRRRWELRDRIARLDPDRDHLEIYQLSAGREFPWDYTRALEFALFRTYCVPSISRLLAATGEFRDRPQKRYDDTSLLMAEIATHGYDSPRGREALKVVNRAHGRFAISNDDMLYVLSTFIYDPIEWLGKYGWRPPHEHEKLAAFHYYREVGRRMGIREIPAGYAEFLAFKQRYEREQFVYSETNRQIGEYTVGLFAAWFPAVLRPAVRLGVRGMLDEPMLRAFGFSPAPRWVGALGDLGLRARALALRFFPPRRTSILGVSPRNRTYPGYPADYHPTDLGAEAPAPDFPAEHLRRA